jgi:hypothetical protein
MLTLLRASNFLSRLDLQLVLPSIFICQSVAAPAYAEAAGSISRGKPLSEIKPNSATSCQCSAWHFLPEGTIAPSRADG